MQRDVQHVLRIDVAAGQAFGGRVVGPPGENRFADDVLVWHESPVAAVLRQVTVVAEHEVVSGRDDEFSAAHVLPEHLQAACVDGAGRSSREVVPIGREVFRLVNFVRFLDGFAVQDKLFGLDPDPVSRDADHSLHIVLGDVQRVTENDDVAALHLLVGQQVPAQSVRRSAGEFVHDQMVANQQVVLHRAGRNHVGLRDHRRSEEQDQEVYRPLRERVQRKRGFRALSLRCHNRESAGTFVSSASWRRSSGPGRGCGPGRWSGSPHRSVGAS